MENGWWKGRKREVVTTGESTCPLEEMKVCRTDKNHNTKTRSRTNHLRSRLSNVEIRISHLELKAVTCKCASRYLVRGSGNSEEDRCENLSA